MVVTLHNKHGNYIGNCNVILIYMKILNVIVLQKHCNSENHSKLLNAISSYKGNSNYKGNSTYSDKNHKTYIKLDCASSIKGNFHLVAVGKFYWKWYL